MGNIIRSTWFSDPSWRWCGVGHFGAICNLQLISLTVSVSIVEICWDRYRLEIDVKVYELKGKYYLWNLLPQEQSLGGEA